MADTPEVIDETEKPEKPTPEQLAEKVAAAEKRAAEAEAEAARMKSEREAPKPQKTSYSISDFSEAEWSAAEAESGKDRKTLLSDINFRAGITATAMNTVESLRAQQAVRDELQDALDSDPLASKYKAEAKKFLADIPGDVVAKDPKKWVAKAIAYGKNTVKLPTSTRKPDTMDTKESGRVKDTEADKGYSIEEKEVFERHGRKAEDYDKIKHPYIPDGSVHRVKDEAPRFGQK